MNWFETLTGVREADPAQVREHLSIDGDQLTSRANGQRYSFGRLETPSLAELRQRVIACEPAPGRLTVREVIANVQDLHADPTHSGALFQVASQFNLLEMVHPSVSPEDGVGIYENDRTQGPACAIACGAGTIYRNYFVHVQGQTGQSATRQLDCLADLGAVLNNTGDRLWKMHNGYALASRTGLVEISGRLRASGEQELDAFRATLRIGVQWNSQVTIRGCAHTVTQAYCSALPVAYSPHSLDLWEDFARLVLEGAYEATICAAILNAQASGSNKVFLTLLGGGAFGNATEWITAAIERALAQFRDCNLDVAIVSYGASNAAVRRLVVDYQN